MVAELDPLAGLNALYQNAPVGLAVLDSRLRYVSINEHLAELNGLPVDVHLGRSVEEMIPRLAPRMVPVMRRVIETGEPLLNSAVSGETQDRPGVQREWLAHYRPLVNESGEIIGLTVVLEEITDRKRTEAIRRQSEEFRLLAEHSTDVIARFDRSLRHLYINPAIENVTGLNREAFIGKTDRELGMPEELTVLWGQKLNATFETGNEQSMEFSFSSPEGKRAFEAHLIPEFGEEGAVQTVLAVTRDITARKRGEEALRESERKYRELIENLYEGIWQLDEQANTTFVNKRMASMLGYTPQEMLGRSLFDFMDEEAVASAKFNMERRREGIKEDHDFRFRRKDGSVIYTRLATSPLYDREGRFSGALGGVVDTTERRQAEEEVRRISRKNQLILNSAGQGIYGLDGEGRCTFVNPAALKMLGYAAEELLGRRTHELFHYAHADGSPYPFSDCPVQMAHRNGSVYQGSDEWYWRKDGSGFPIDYVSTPVEEDGRIIGSVVGFTDITERKRAEDALLESERKYRELVENLYEGIWLIDEHANTVFVNDRLAEMLGYRADEMLGKKLSEFMSGTAAASARENLKKGYAGVKADYEFVFQRKDRTPVFTRIATSPLFDDRGHYRGALAAVMDLTERKRAEALLQRREEELRMAQSQGKLGSWTWDLATDTITWSEELYRIHGLPPGEPLPGFEGIAEFFTRESAQRLREVVQQTLQSGEPYEVDVEPLCPDGVRKWSIARGGVVRDESGRIAGLRGTETDITERRQIEEALRESEARFRQVFELVPDVLYRVPLPGHHAQFISPAIKQLLGFTPEEWQTDPEIWVRQLHDEDRERVLDEMETALREVNDYTQQYRMWHKDGRTLRWFEDRHKIERDHQGKPFALFGAINDITDRKRAEETIRQREQEFRALAELSPDIVARFDRNLRYLYINPAIERAVNRPRSFFVGKTIGEVGISEDVVISLAYQLRSVFRTKRVGAFEFTYPRSDGKQHYFDSRFVPEFGDDGRVKTVIMVSRDVTGLRDSEEQLKTNARELEIVNGRLEALARQDELTGLANRRYLFNYMETEWRREARHNHPISLIIADVDHFKLFNDRYGHIAGDNCLRSIAAALRAQVRRPGDLLARYGGEEFIAVLPETTLEGAWKLAETMREGVAELQLEHDASPVAPIVTVSLGVASISSRHTVINQLINRADEALYAAKQEGRNRVCVAREQ